jgi:hypothetical protein
MNGVPQIDGDALGADAEQAAALERRRADEVDARRVANLVAALRLASAGVPVFPVRLSQGPKGDWKKIPAIENWQAAASADAARVGIWWDEFPDAVPGIALGKCRLVVIDPDRHPGGADGVAAFAEIARRHQELPPHPLTHTAGGGEHHVFRQRDGEPLGNRSGKLPAGICVRGAGGFVVAPGAVRPDGAAWRANGDAPDLADAFRNGAIPAVPEWLVELIRGDVPPVRMETGASTTGDRERKYAAAALAGCVDELERSARGSRNNTLNALSFHLGRMVARGWLEEQSVHDALARAAAACGLVADDGEAAVRATTTSGLNGGRANPHPDLSDSAPPLVGQSPPTVPVTWDGDAEAEPTAWLVKDMIPEGAVGFLVGESRAGKSFLAVHLAAALGRGRPFFTKRVRQGGTLYVAAEAARTIPGRLKAARLGPLAPFLDQNGRHKEDGSEPARLPVAMIPGGLDLLTEHGLQELIRIARDASLRMQAKAGVPLRLIVIDTTLAAFSIGNWNDPADVSRVTCAMARIARETGAAVLGIHHHGKDISRGPAGSYALTAAADCIISVLCDGDIEGNVAGRRIALTKQRDGATGWGCEFSLRPHKIGTDEHGEDIVSAYVEATEITAGSNRSKSSKARPPSGSLSTFMDALAAALNGHGQDQPTGNGPPARVVAVQHVRDAFADRYEPASPPAKRDEASRKAFTRAMRDALLAGTVAELNNAGGQWLMRTEKA